MANVRGFLLSHFGRTYFLIFLPFFSILSIVYIIRISILSNKIVLDAEEILRLFGFFLPDILFYTLPLTFIVALSATLIKLSEDNELVALFSFGFTPLKLLQIFFLPALLFSILILILSLYTIPQSTMAYKIFKDKKTLEAKLNISPNRLGQKFGKFIVFIGHKKQNIYHDIVLFDTSNNDKRVLVAAHTGEMQHDKSQFSLNLYQGTGDTFLANQIESIRYAKMRIFHYTRSKLNHAWLGRGWKNITENKKDMALFIYNIFLSLSPLLTLGVILAFSIINPRYQKSNTYLISFLLILFIYLLASVLKKDGTPTLLLLSSGFFLVASTIFFVKKTKAHF